MIRPKRKVRVAGLHRRQRLRARRASVRSNNGSSRRARAGLRTSRGLSRRRAAVRAKRSGAPAQEPAERQQAHLQYLAAVKNFEVGLRHLQKQNYEKSREIFEKLASSAADEVANRARTYLRMCERKLGRAGSLPKTAAEYYDLGVAQLNARNLDSAIEHLSKADRLGPNQDHVQYALAAAHTLLGNVEAALGHLKSAIALRRANRFLACKDEDFQSLVDDPRFRRLLRSEAT